MGSIAALILILIAAGAAFFLWAIRPAAGAQTDCAAYLGLDYAHRGLWDARAGIPENSLPAFSAAVRAGYAIELDVHLTADGQVVVFHDDDTARMCGQKFRIEATDYAVLAALRLAGTSERIPLLSEVLTLVNGRVPLLIELKLPVRSTALCPALMQLLDAYRGPYLIESFNPIGLLWFRRHRPEIVRGQLSTRFSRQLKLPAPAKWLTTSLMVNLLGRPHFIAYDLRHTGRFGFRAARLLYRVPAFLWTIRTPEQYSACKARSDAVIFEVIRPHVPQQSAS